MALTAIILAAGKSTRMKSALPKPLHEVCGRPMLGYILDAAFDAGAERAIVVVGHGKDLVIERFGDDARIDFVEQTEQLGTGHAVKVCVPHLENAGLEGDVIVLAGDLPLIRADVLKQLVAGHRQANAALSLATAELDNPFGYGRVIRDDMGRFIKIIEQFDATPAEAAVREVFPSITCGRADVMADALAKLRNDNAKGEYYFTDVFEIAQNAGRSVLAIKCVLPTDIVAPNTRQQLAEAGRVMQGRIQIALFDSGVGIPDPDKVYVEHGATIGRDSTLMPFTFIGRDARIGESCTVGPFGYVARGGVVTDGQTIAGNVPIAASRRL